VAGGCPGNWVNELINIPLKKNVFKLISGFVH
jgi:hypothetical protein